MIQKLKRIFTLLGISLICFGGAISAQNTRSIRNPDWCSPQAGLNGLYRIDFDRSDQLYSVIEEASSNIPFGEQQQFFIDLSVRLAPPDLLAIECRANRISLASSRADRVEFLADGVTRTTRSDNGDSVRTRIWFDRSGLMFTSSGGNSDTLNFNFVPIDNGTALRVTRRISAKELIEPVVIRTIYNKISGAARWDIFEDSQIAEKTAVRKDKTVSPNSSRRIPAKTGDSDAAEDLRGALRRWIAATNRLDIESQMSFYTDRLKAFYLTRNVSVNAVRSEKNRAFAAAKSISITAAEPEIIFQNGGREAIMRFRKTYDIRSGAKSRSGVVIQELRWQQTAGGWKIFSERDIRVIR